MSSHVSARRATRERRVGGVPTSRSRQGFTQGWRLLLESSTSLVIPPGFTSEQPIPPTLAKMLWSLASLCPNVMQTYGDLDTPSEPAKSGGIYLSRGAARAKTAPRRRTTSSKLSIPTLSRQQGISSNRRAKVGSCRKNPAQQGSGTGQVANWKARNKKGWAHMAVSSGAGSQSALVAPAAGDPGWRGGSGDAIWTVRSNQPLRVNRSMHARPLVGL